MFNPSLVLQVPIHENETMLKPFLNLCFSYRNSFYQNKVLKSRDIYEKAQRNELPNAVESRLGFSLLKLSVPLLQYTENPFVSFLFPFEGLHTFTLLPGRLTPRFSTAQNFQQQENLHNCSGDKHFIFRFLCSFVETHFGQKVTYYLQFSI